MSETWQDAWQPVMDAVGQDLGDGATRFGPDAVELGSIRRWMESLEFDCALHYDRETAVEYGYSDVTAPYTSIVTFAIPATWIPGRDVFTSADRDAQPAFTPISKPDLALAPPTTGFFATGIEIDFLRPAVNGDRIGSRGFRLLSCVPKETSVGRGAFLTWQSELVDEEGNVLIRQRTATYAYNPFAAASDALEESL
jgi:hypothetical protein